MKNKKIIDIYLPELGEGITSVEISDILIDIGDLINIEDPIIIVETEKASMEIPTTRRKRPTDLRAIPAFGSSRR